MDKRSDKNLDKMLDKTLEERIRERAYEIWTTNGCHEGEADQHWLVAEREVLAKLMAEAPPAAPMATKAASRKPRSRATPTTAKPAARAVAH